MSNEIGVRAVERAIAILDVLAQGGSRTGAEIARELHVHRSTALRLLGTLERHALVERDQRTARYRLGRRGRRGSSRSASTRSRAPSMAWTARSSRRWTSRDRPIAFATVPIWTG